MAEENFCQYVSSYGIIKSCQIRSITPHFCRFINYNFDPMRADMPDYTVIYVCNADMKSFYPVFRNIRRKFVLVSGDADETFPRDVLTDEQFREMLDSDKLVHWYAQNCVVSSPKITKMPIGLDYHSISRGGHEWGAKMSPIAQELQIDNIMRTAPALCDRELKCYCNFHFSLDIRKYASDRFDAMREIAQELMWYEPRKTVREECYRNQINFAFVVSPQGNGFDCHRTWESLVLGNIVIVKTSPLDELFADLPVWIVKEWSEVTLPRMAEIRDEFAAGRRFSFEKLTLKYWREKFYSHAANAKEKNRTI
jgi:hypothetical protein